MAMIANSDVSVATLRDVLNAAGGSVSNDATSFFTANAKINWASKHKPVIYAKNFCQDLRIGDSDYDETWWLGTSQLCGLLFIPLGSIAELPSAYDGDMNGWTYPLPTGGANAPMRLGDFCHYDTDAKPPMYNFEVHNMVNTTSVDRIAMGINVVGDTSNNISFLDMPLLKNYYLGLYLEHKSTGLGTWNAQSTPLTAGWNTIDINPYQMREGEYWAYPFISEEPQLQSRPILNTVIYTLPGVAPLTMKINSAASAYVVTLNIKSATRLELLVAFSIKNNTTENKTFKTNFIRVRMKGMDFDEPLTSEDYEEELGDLTIGAGLTYTKNITIPLIGYPALQEAGVVYLSLDAADILKSANYTVSDSGGSIT